MAGSVNSRAKEQFHNPFPPIPPKKDRVFPDMAIVLLSFVAVCGFLVFQQPLTLFNDNLTEVLPLHVMAARAIAKGHLPLWNPFCWAGTPLLSNPQAGVLYPPHWLSVWLFGIFPSMEVLFFAHVAWGFVGAHLLLRRLRYTPLASGAGALIFVFSGFTLTTAQHWLHMLEVGSWTPWILLFSHMVYEQKTGKPLSILPMACLTSSIALQIFAGYPEFVLYTWGFVPIFLLLFHDRSSKGTLAVSVSLLSGALIASIQWLPALHEYLYSVRKGGFPLQASLALSLPLKTLLGSIIPAVQVHLPEVNKDIFSSILCWGVGLPLATVTLTKKVKALLLWLLFGFFLILSLGGNGYLYPLLWRVLPGFKLFRFPFKYVFLGNLILMFLLAEGWNRHAKKIHLFLWGLLGSVSLLYALTRLSKSPFLAHQVLFSLFLFFIAGLYKHPRLVFVILAASLILITPIHHKTATHTGYIVIPSTKSPWKTLPYAFSHRFLSLYDRHPSDIPAQYSLAWNWPAIYGIPSVNGLGAFVPAELQEKFGIGNEIPYQKALAIIKSPQTLDSLAIKYLIFIKNSPLYSLINRLDPRRFKIVADNGSVTVASYNHAKPIVGFTNPEGCVITSQTLSPDGVHLKTRTTRKCELFLSTLTKEGWHASSSQGPLSISKTDHGILVSVPRGTHRLFLRLIPPWSVPALCMGLAGIAIFILFTLLF